MGNRPIAKTPQEKRAVLKELASLEPCPFRVDRIENARRCIEIKNIYATCSAGIELQGISGERLMEIPGAKTEYKYTVPIGKLAAAVGGMESLVEVLAHVPDMPQQGRVKTD